METPGLFTHTGNERELPNYRFNGRLNPFAPLPPPALYQHLYFQEHPVPEDLSEVIVIDTAEFPSQPTPPIVLRDDQFEIMEISQDEFLQSIPGWQPVPLNFGR